MITDNPHPPMQSTAGTASPAIIDALPLQYLEQRRRAIITELREIDRVLGRPQTVPQKDKGQ